VIGGQEMKLALNLCGVHRAYEEYGVYAPFRMSLMVRHGAMIIAVISISMHVYLEVHG
jgi:ABC-type phosphate transport system permease subunit